MNKCKYCNLPTAKHGYCFGKDFAARNGTSLCIRNYDGKHYVLLFEDGDVVEKIPIKYCPMCGKKLMEEQP